MQTVAAQKASSALTTKDWLESIPAGVVFITPEGEIDCFNKQAEDLLALQKPLPNWSEALSQNVKQVVSNGHYIVLANGKCVVFKTQSLPNAKGQLVLLVDETDIYQSHICSMQLQNLDSIEKLSASLAHQLRTPLSTAILYASNLPSDTVDQDKIMKQLLLIKQQIEEVLMVCKGQEKMIENIAIYEEIVKLLDDYKQLHSQSMIHLQQDEECKQMIILGHKASLLGAFTNIIDNAIQASDAQQRIDIRLHKVANGLRIDIQDYGKGINPDTLEQVKKPFFTTKQNGTGLGLSIAKSILEAHQGTLEIASVANQYTTVSLYLPYAFANGQ